MSGIARPGIARLGTAAGTAVVINNVGLLMLLDNVTASCNNLVADTAVVTNKVGLQAT